MQLLWNKLDDRKIQFCVANSMLLFSGENMLMSAELKGFVMLLFSGSSLGKVWQILGRGDLSAPSPEKAHPEYG